MQGGRSGGVLEVLEGGFGGIWGPWLGLEVSLRSWKVDMECVGGVRGTPKCLWEFLRGCGLVKVLEGGYVGV